MNVNKVDNKKMCSKLQIRGVSNLVLPLDSITCVESSENKLVIRYEEGYVSDKSIQYLSDHNMFEILDNNPNGNQEVLIRVLDKDTVDIDEKNVHLY